MATNKSPQPADLQDIVERLDGLADIVNKLDSLVDIVADLRDSVDKVASKMVEDLENVFTQERPTRREEF